MTFNFLNFQTENHRNICDKIIENNLEENSNINIYL